MGQVMYPVYKPTYVLCKAKSQHRYSQHLHRFGKGWDLCHGQFPLCGGSGTKLFTLQYDTGKSG